MLLPDKHRMTLLRRQPKEQTNEQAPDSDHGLRHSCGGKQNSMTAGPRGPVLLQDYHLIEKLQHFNRERVPERVVHAKGSGAYGILR